MALTTRDMMDIKDIKDRMAMIHIEEVKLIAKI